MDEPVLVILDNETLLSPVASPGTNILYLVLLGSTGVNTHRAVCSGWVDTNIKSYLDERGIYYAGAAPHAAGYIAQLERSTTAVQTALAA